MEAFRDGDLVLIEDGYAGAPHKAKVVAVTPEVLVAEGPHLPGDSRVLQWEIQHDRVADMVTQRTEPAEDAT